MAMVGSVNNALNTLNSVNNATQKTTQKIATGSKYSTPSNGAAAYATLKKMGVSIDANSQSVQNVQTASAMMRTAEGATSKTLTALTEIKVYLMNAANDTNTASERADMQKHVNQIVEQIDDNSRVTYNGINILDGSQENMGIAGVLGYQNYNMGDIRAETLGLKDSEGNVTINLNDPNAVKASLETVDNALDKVQGINDSLKKSIAGEAMDASLDEITTQGAYAQRLDYQEALYNTMAINEQEAASTAGGVDMAKAASELKSEETQKDLASSASNLYRHNYSNILELLQGA
ncbi:MAG: flagellin [Selenomonadaceae bacterium]|nr:flagellin [Selenomonadaceae bacterium]